MSATLESVIYLIIVAIFWGVTNPFMKKGAHGIENVEAITLLEKCRRQILFLVTNFQYVIPFLVNQCGSLLYVSILGSTDLSLAVPVTNGLTFAITAVTGWLLGEEKPYKATYFGTLLILIGTMLCCYEKISFIPADEAYSERLKKQE